jgi:hypothetical protein
MMISWSKCRPLNRSCAEVGSVIPAVIAGYRAFQQFVPEPLETAEHLSKLIGTTTIIKEQVTQSGRGFLGTQVSRTMQEVQWPLLTSDECQRMPGPQKDEHDRITAAGDMVIKTFTAPAAIPAPTHRSTRTSSACWRPPRPSCRSFVRTAKASSSTSHRSEAR